MLHIHTKLAVGLVVGGLLALLSLQPGPGATVLTQSSLVLASAAAGSAPVVNYQARLLNPSTGEPKADGVYAMIFALYTGAEGGTALWSETESVNVKGGLFATLLGDQTPLDGTVLNGQDLWLGVTVGSDPETAPRQRIAHAAYAVYANTAGYANDANALDGNDSAAFAPAGHTHPGGEGPLAFAYINTDGSKNAGTANVSSIWETTDGGRYRITISGVSYFYSDYITVVTPASFDVCDGATATVGSFGGALLVYMLNASSTQIQCGFQFVTFKP